jgi:hypothetical protein
MTGWIRGTGWRTAMALVALLLAGADALSGQGVSVRGTVRSTGGDVIVDATVTFERGGGAVGAATVQTDADGRYTLTLRDGAAGRLTFTHPRYRAEARGIEAASAGVRSAEGREVSVFLTPLFAVDAVSVTAERARPLLDTRNAATGGTVERAELAALPTDARNPLTLAFTVPGVAQATGFFGDAPPLSIHGANALYTRYELDGLDNNEGFLGGPRVEFPLAATSRLEVLGSSYGASRGASAHGIVNVESRSGGERWEGEAFLFGRPGMPLDAAPKFAPAGTDPDGFRRFQMGGATGGPLLPGRTFVFAAAEYSNEREDRIGSTARTQFIGTELRETWKLFGRVDHGWSPTQTTTFRSAVSDLQRRGQGGGVIVPEADITTVRRGAIHALTHRSVLAGGRASHTASLQLGTYRWDFPPSESDLQTPQVTIVAPDLVTVEAVVGSSNFIFDERETQLQLRQVVDVELGRGHRLRLGGDVSRGWFRLRGSGTNPLGAWTVVNEGNIRPAGRFVSITDIPADVRVLRYSVDANPQQVDRTQTLIGLFVEDEWRPTPSVTVLAGVRWDYDDITSRGESSPDLDNLQPRVSATWLVNGATVLRGGAGIHTGRFPYAIYSDAVQFGPEGNAVVTLEGAQFPPPRFRDAPSSAALEALQGRFPPREIRRMFALGLEQPESRQLSLGVQRQLGSRWSLAVDGVWVETRNLPRSWDLNALDRPLTPGDTVNLPAAAGDPFRPVTPVTGGFRRLTTTESGGRARHQALHLNLRGALTSALGGEATWVWSRTQNDTEDINFNATRGNDFAAEWADAINDRRHRVSVRGYLTPLAALRLALIADWQTGTPINRIAYFRDLDGSGDIFGNGFVGNHDRFPGVPRNGERLPDALQLSAGATLNLPLLGRATEVRAEVFNLLNSTILTGFANGIPGGGPRTQVGRPGDPVVWSAAAPPRQFQLSATVRFP